jgi:hypothetical protein
VKRFLFNSFLLLSFPAGKSNVFLAIYIRQKEEVSMKKMIGMIALCVVGLAVSSTLAQAPAMPESIAATAAAIEASVAAAAAPVAAPAAQELTLKGKVSVVKGPDGTLKFIFINPAEGHGYKVDIMNGEGKTLADKHGKTVEAVGVDANRLFTIKTITVIE